MDETKDDDHSAFNHPDLVGYFSSGRCRPEDLYPSERRFLPWLAAGTGSVLDAGCAAGGFADIWSHFAPDVEYVGTDVSPPLVDVARRLRPDCRFEVADTVAGLPFPDQGFDTVQALGWLHWEPRYQAAIDELWRVSSGRLFFDVRLRPPGSGMEVGEQRLSYSRPWDGRTTTPYLVVDAADLLGLLLEHSPGRILGYGYEGTVDDSVLGIGDGLCFATFVLERQGPRSGPVPAVLDLPWSLEPPTGCVVSSDLDEVLAGGHQSALRR